MWKKQIETAYSTTTSIYISYGFIDAGALFALSFILFSQYMCLKSAYCDPCSVCLSVASRNADLSGFT